MTQQHGKMTQSPLKTIIIVSDILAGVLLEVWQREGDIRPETKEFLQTARKLCDDVGAVLICDAQVRKGRTAKL